MSRGSTRFLTSFLEDAESVPPTGQSAAWQGDALIAAAALGCTITGCTDPSRALELLGNGGPLVLAGCPLGAAGEPAHQVQVGGFTQGTVVLVDCSVNSLAPVVVRDDGVTEGTRPRAQLLRVRGPGGALLPAEGAALPALAFPLAPSARRRADRPAAPEPQVLLGTGEFIPFVTDGERHFLEDSTELVQQALDALAQSGGTLYLPPALYTIKKTLVLRGARGARIAGVGSRGGASVFGPGLVRGTVLAWDGPTLGPVLRIEDCEDLVLEGLHFTTAGAPGTQGEIATVDTMITIASGQRLWLEDLGAGWLAGDGGAQDTGVCSTFLRIGAGAAQVTLRAAQLQQVAREGVLVDGARGVELSLYVVADSRCALRLAGGEVAWFGGGAGNGAARMGGGATIVLEDGAPVRRWHRGPGQRAFAGAGGGGPRGRRGRGPSGARAPRWSTARPWRRRTVAAWLRDRGSAGRAGANGAGPRVTVGAWQRLVQQAEHARTALLLIGEQPVAGSAACATIECRPGPAHWLPCPGGRLLLTGRKISYEVTRSRLGAPLGPQALFLRRA